MYQLVIVENESDQTEALLWLIRRFPRSSAFDIVCLSGAEELESYLEGGGAAHILMVDINLGEDVPNGIDLVQRYVPPGSGVQVIYVTGHLEYCTRVYRTEHLYFLAKPIAQQDIDDALGKALDNLEREKLRSLSVRTGGTLKAVPLWKIAYFESDRRKVRLHMGNEVLETYASLSKLLENLPPSFVSCHKSFVVNLDYAVELQKDVIVLRSGESVPVSQKRRKNVRAAFLAYLKTQI